MVVLRILVGIVIIAIGGFIASVLIGMKPEPPVSSPPKAKRLVEVMPASVQAQAPKTYVQGRVIALDKIEIFAEVSGVVQSSNKDFRAGTRYRRGDVMLRLDGSELRMSLIAQRSAFLQLLTGALADIKIDYPDRYETWRSYTANLDVESRLKDMPSPASDQEKFFLSNRGILNQFYSIRSSEERLDKYVLTAPFTGEVTMSSVNPGSLVRVGQKIGELVSGGGFEVESAISRDALRVVQVGDSVEFMQAGSIIKGKVTRISESIDPATQTAKIFCQVNNENLRDGVYLEGKVYSQSVADVTRIPLDLLLDDQTVFVLEQDSILEAKAVEVIYASSKDALIRGLSNNAELISERIPGAYDGMIVKAQRP